MSIKLGGYDSLKKKLGNMDTVVREALEQSILESAILVEGRAKLNVPADTGALRESISHEMKVTKKEVTGIVGTNMEYAPYVELGTGPVGAENSPEIARKLNVTYRNTPWVYYSESRGQFFTTSGQAGQPYLYPALESSRAEIENRVASRVEDALKEVAKK